MGKEGKRGGRKGGRERSKDESENRDKVRKETLIQGSAHSLKSLAQKTRKP